MKAVLISIQPKWCELIANGKKTIELRKSKPKLETPFMCYIYCTKGKDLLREVDCWTSKAKIHTMNYKIINLDYCTNKIANGKVIGEFICEKIEDFSKWEYDYPSLLRHIDLYAGTNLAYVSIDYYLKGEKKGYGWHISELKIYDKPKELSEFFSCKGRECSSCNDFKMANDGIYDCFAKLTRPPQSWCYVEQEK